MIIDDIYKNIDTIYMIESTQQPRRMAFILFEILKRLLGGAVSAVADHSPLPTTPNATLF